MTIELDGVGIDIDKPTRRYVQKVVGGLDHFLAKNVREAAHATVTLQRVDQPHGNKYEARVHLRAGTNEYSASDTTLNMLAALDIVKAKLVNQLTSI